MLNIGPVAVATRSEVIRIARRRSLFDGCLGLHPALVDCRLTDPALADEVSPVGETGADHGAESRHQSELWNAETGVQECPEIQC